MQYIQPVNVASTTITVSSTAGTLASFMDTAGSTTGNYEKLAQCNGIDFCVEANDVRVTLDGSTPTATDGLLLQANTEGIYSFRGLDLTKINLIRDAGSDVAISVQIGKE